MLGHAKIGPVIGPNSAGWTHTGQQPLGVRPVLAGPRGVES